MRDSSFHSSACLAKTGFKINKIRQRLRDIVTSILIPKVGGGPEAISRAYAFIADHRLANLRVLKATEFKTVPYVPLSHPFVERLIGTVRRECLDRTLFRYSGRRATLEAKLLDFQHYYYNEHRTHGDAKGGRRKRAMPIAHEQILVVIDGRSIVEAYTKRRLLHDLGIRHPHVIKGFREASRQTHRSRLNSCSILELSHLPQRISVPDL